ncbi:hypothetical protein Tco_1316025 [Tanacetum coccineum]
MNNCRWEGSRFESANITARPPQYIQNYPTYSERDLKKILYNRMWQERFGIRLEPSYSGCAPEMMTRYNTNVCVDAINGAVVQFNAKLVAALGELESKLTGAKFIYMNPSLANSTEKG